MIKTQKKPIVRAVQDPTPGNWRVAPRPNYSTNTDLHYPYSEYPRTYESGYEYYSTKLTTLDLGSRIVDFWGEGRIVAQGLVTGFRNAYNINHQFQLVSNGADKDCKIPNRIPTIDYTKVSVEKYVPDSSVDIITLMGAPIPAQTAAEMARMISRQSHSVIVIYGFEESSRDITNLEVELDSIGFVLSPLYELNSQLREVTLSPALAFCLAGVVTQQATSFFRYGDMNKCATILCSLQKSSKNQRSAQGALKSFFAQDVVRNSYLIFKLGYILKSSPEGPAVMSLYMNANVVKIVKRDYYAIKLVSNFSSESAYLCTNGKVGSGSWQWAFFGASSYISPTYDGGQKFVFDPINGGEQFQIQSSFGSLSYLCTNGKVPSGSWQWAFFGTSSYVDSSSYNGGQNFNLIPVDGGNTFQIQSNFGVTAYLCTNGKVSSGSWQYAFFGTPTYLDSSSYRGGNLFSLVFL
jgi:hypothetical protein